MSLLRLARSFRVRSDPHLTPLLEDTPRLPLGAADRATLRAVRLEEIPEVLRDGMFVLLGLPSPLKAELRDPECLIGVAHLMGRDLGRRIGRTSALHYRSPQANIDFLRGPLREAVLSIVLFGEAGHFCPASIRAFADGVRGQAAVEHMLIHAYPVHEVPLRRAQQLWAHRELIDTLDLYRSARDAVLLHPGPHDAVSVAYEAQSILFGETAENIRRHEAVQWIHDQRNSRQDADTRIHQARSGTRCRYPFGFDHRQLIAEVLPDTLAPGVATPAG